MDSVSEQEMLDLSEAAYLVTKSGQSQPEKAGSGSELKTNPKSEPTVVEKKVEKKSAPSLRKHVRPQPKARSLKRFC